MNPKSVPRPYWFRCDQCGEMKPKAWYGGKGKGQAGPVHGRRGQGRANRVCRDCRVANAPEWPLPDEP